MHLIGFTIEMYYDARPNGRQILPLVYKNQSVSLACRKNRSVF